MSDYLFSTQHIAESQLLCSVLSNARGEDNRLFAVAESKQAEGGREG